MTEGLPHGWRVTIDWLVTIVGAIVIVLAIKAWVVNPYRIPSSSMEPTLHCARPGAGLRGELLRPRARVPVLLPVLEPEARRHHRLQDAAARRAPLRRRRHVREARDRAAGDTWEERDGYVYIDGKRLNEPYIKPDRRDDRTIAPMVIPKDQYFMMGDNRQSSCDSRSWGTVPKKNLIGKVFATYWPPNRISIQ